ncbi:hypothetical protein [Hymenobacter siberiensis]|uniref:hypothetical protein n=1 Tax=Hymenobacter siberiensis TaxID=2848396 RepID=UPI001C1E676A|nr:hypothetical protein [Hymenobacter siberiensis]
MKVFFINHATTSAAFSRALADAHRVMRLDDEVEKIFLCGIGHNGQVSKIKRPKPVK